MSRSAMQTGMWSAAAAGSALMLYGLFEARWVRIRREVFVHPKVPDSMEGVCIALISDLHFGGGFTKARLGRLVSRINGLNPDLVLIAGDFVERREDIDACFGVLAGLRAPMGCFGVLGNHDHRAGGPEVEGAMERAGIGCLENRGFRLERSGGRIRLAGFRNERGGGPDPAAALGNVSEEAFTMVLTHDPDEVDAFEDPRVPLILAGHSHGGQITLFGLWAPFTSSRFGQKYRGGWVRERGRSILVTRGVGTTKLPLRFFARPEIVLLTLRGGDPP